MKNRVENMNEAELENVAGGLPPIPTGDIPYKTITIHKGCGGEIIWHFFTENVCDKCGEAHFFMTSFDTETIRIDKNGNEY